MSDQSQTPVTKEMWYIGQKTHSDLIKELKKDIKSIELIQKEIIGILKELTKKNYNVR